MKHARSVQNGMAGAKIVDMCVCIGNNSQFHSTISFPFPIKIDIIFTIFPHLNISIGFDCEKCLFFSTFSPFRRHLRNSVKKK